MVWECGSRTFDLSEPVFMGILNVTPDSFSDGGEHSSVGAALAYAQTLLEQGAHVIDVGGESTRPGSNEVDAQDELGRVLPVVQALAAQGVAVSVDTRHAQVAAACLEAGACIINDVSGMRDVDIRRVVAQSDCGVVIMHMLGEPKGMQMRPEYTDVVAEIEEYLLHAAAQLEHLGVSSGRICLDPGIGFGKTRAHNQALLEATSRFAALGYPLMVAVSRKSYIGACTGIEAPSSRDAASALCAASALLAGASVARVHDVAASIDAQRSSRRAFVALGSNIGVAGLSGDGRVAQIEAAIEALRKTPEVWVSAVSSCYETEPAYYEAQAPFANAVAQVQTTLGPSELLDELHRIESAQGRVRSMPNGPRTLDLDILDYEGVVSTDPAVTLPHPRVLERDFTVTPLLEIAPAAVLADGTAVTRERVAYGTVVGKLG